MIFRVWNWGWILDKSNVNFFQQYLDYFRQQFDGPKLQVKKAKRLRLTLQFKRTYTNVSTLRPHSFCTCWILHCMFADDCLYLQCLHLILSLLRIIFLLYLAPSTGDHSYKEDFLCGSIHPHLPQPWHPCNHVHAVTYNHTQIPILASVRFSLLDFDSSLDSAGF